MVTGASEGIGRGYALEVRTCVVLKWADTLSSGEQLARQGLNVIIMSRSLDKLSAVEWEISELHIARMLLLVMSCSTPMQRINSRHSEVIVFSVDFLEGNLPLPSPQPPPKVTTRHSLE